MTRYAVDATIRLHYSCVVDADDEFEAMKLVDGKLAGGDIVISTDNAYWQYEDLDLDATPVRDAY